MSKMSKKYGLDFEVFRDEIRFNIIDLETQEIKKYSASKDLLTIRKLIKDSFYLLDADKLYNKIVPDKVYFAHNAPFDRFVAYWIYDNMKEFTLQLCEALFSCMINDSINYNNDNVFRYMGIYESSPDIKIIEPSKNHGVKNIPKHSLKVYAPYVHLEHDHFDFKNNEYYYKMTESELAIFDSYEDKDLKALYLIMKNVNYKSAGMPYLEMLDDVTSYVNTFYPALLNIPLFHHDLYKNASTAFSKYILKKDKENQQVYLRLEHEIQQREMYQDLQLKKTPDILDNFINHRRLLLIEKLKELGVSNEDFINTLFELGLLIDIDSVGFKNDRFYHNLSIGDFYDHKPTNELLLIKYNIINNETSTDFKIIKDSGYFKEILKYDNDLFDYRYAYQDLMDVFKVCVKTNYTDLDVINGLIEEKLIGKKIKFKKVQNYIDVLISSYFLDCEYIKSYYGLDCLVGKGGVHTVHTKTESFKSDSNYTIVDIDIVQSYPSEMVRMNELKCIYNNQVIADKIRERNEYKKDPVKSKFVKAIKFLTVSAFGSVQYFSTFSILNTGINLRDRITALCRYKLLKKLEVIKNKYKDEIKLIQVNTDGLTLYIPNSIKEEFKDLVLNDSVNKWEYGEFDYVLVKDVNNYIACDFEGNIKEKGAFSSKNKINSGNFYHPLIVDYLLKDLKLKDTLNESLKDLKIFVNKKNIICDWVYLKGLNLEGFAFKDSYQHYVTYSLTNEFKESEIYTLVYLLKIELGIEEELNKTENKEKIEKDILKLEETSNDDKIEYNLSLGKINFAKVNIRNLMTNNYKLFKSLMDNYDDICITCKGFYVFDFDFAVNENNTIFLTDDFKTYTIYKNSTKRCKMFFINDLTQELSTSKKIFKYIRETFDFKDEDIIELLKPNKNVRIHSKDYDVIKYKDRFLPISSLFKHGLCVKIPRVDQGIKKKKDLIIIS